MFLKDRKNDFYLTGEREIHTQGRHVRPLNTAGFGSAVVSGVALPDFRSRRQISHKAVI